MRDAGRWGKYISGRKRLEHVKEGFMRKTIRIVLELIVLAAVLALYVMINGFPDIQQKLSAQRSGVEKNGPSERANVVLLGQQAKASGPVNIVLKQPIDLKGKTKDEILKLREEQLLWHWDVFGDEAYQPVPAILSAVDESRPWWGLDGEYHYGEGWTGEQNIEGPSEESRFLLNPLLLVALVDLEAVTDILKVDDSTSNSEDRWDSNIEEKSPDFFPAYSGPRSLVWWPAQSRAEARYDAGSHFRDFMEGEGASENLEERRMILWLTAYNAQDFGFHWAYISLEHSQNVSHGNHLPEPFQLREFIHVGGSCGYPGGCNNASPFVKELCCFRVSHFPAKVQVFLWKDKPDSAETTPDMIFDIWVE